MMNDEHVEDGVAGDVGISEPIRDDLIDARKGISGLIYSARKSR